MDLDLLDRDLEAVAGAGPGAGSGLADPARDPRRRGAPSRSKEQAEDDAGPSDLLHRYIRSLGALAVLSREQTYALARELEAARGEFVEAVCGMPGTAVKVVERWRERGRRGHVTAALSAHYRDGSGRDVGRRVDRALSRVQGLLDRRADLAGARDLERRRERARVEAAIARELVRAEIAFEVLLGTYEGLRALRDGAGTRSASAECRRLDLGSREARARLARAAKALERLRAASQTFVRHNLRLVIKQAKRFRGFGVPYLDLIQEGTSA